MTTSLTEGLPEKPASHPQTTSNGRRAVLLIVALAALGTAAYLTYNSISNPSGTRPLDQGMAATTSTAPQPQAAPRPAQPAGRQAPPVGEGEATHRAVPVNK